MNTKIWQKSRAYSLFILAMLPVLLLSCKFNVVPDPVDPGLPAYTTSGDNIAGAIVNDIPWKARYGCAFFLGCRGGVEFRNNFENNNLQVNISSNDVTTRENRFEIDIFLNDIQINDPLDYLNLHNRKFPLDGVNYAMINSLENDCRSSSGQIYFKDVFKLDEEHILVAGTFGFVIDQPDCENFNVFKGRFSRKVRIIL